MRTLSSGGEVEQVRLGTDLCISMRFFRRMGKIVPPMLEPLAMHASARPSFLSNQCGTTPDAAVNTTPLLSCTCVAQ